jgi:murein DD-endopeptidase MepM/ murein hydrolase activator NlpD
MNQDLAFTLQKYKTTYHPIIKIDAEKDSFFAFNFTASNMAITKELIGNTTLFTEWINAKLKSEKASFGIGGYNENRTLYSRSNLFDAAQARTLHLGVDIWGPAGTPVYAPIGGMVHSFAFNNNFGDYGATIILQHNLDTTAFYTLYGHLSLADLTEMRVGKFVTRGEVFAHFGNAEENGNWPPHLHFQIIEDIGLWEGDYPGVCSLDDAEKFLKNSPDANLMLNLYM